MVRIVAAFGTITGIPLDLLFNISLRIYRIALELGSLQKLLAAYRVMLGKWPEGRMLIQKTPASILPNLGSKDDVYWTAHASGSLTVKSAMAVTRSLEPRGTM